jgi:hypothetical protein
MSDSHSLRGLPTTSARTRRGTWAPYPDGSRILVVHPGGSMVGSPGDVAAALDWLTAGRGPVNSTLRPPAPSGGC